LRAACTYLQRADAPIYAQCAALGVAGPLDHTQPKENSMTTSTPDELSEAHRAEERACTKCGEVKPLEAFPVSRDRGRHGQCKECRYRRFGRWQSQPEVRARRSAQEHQRRTRMRAAEQEN
jgi:hypothetical protein